MTGNGIKSLRWLIFNFPKFENPKDDAEKISNCIHLHCQNVVDELNRQRAEIEDLTYKLVGVMHSVDKWLDGDELKQDEVNRAATMREKTLRITEKQRAEIESLNGCVKSEDEVRAIMKSQMTPMVKEIVNEQFDIAVKLAKTEAITEFAERLKESIDKDFRLYGNCTVYDAVKHIDNLVKEMVGDE